MKRRQRAEQDAYSVPVPGEDGEPQTVDEEQYWPAIYLMAIVLAGVFTYYVIKAVMAYLAARGGQ